MRSLVFSVGESRAWGGAVVTSRIKMRRSLRKVVGPKQILVVLDVRRALACGPVFDTL